MPTYIDCHALAAIPSAIQRQMPREALRGILDQHGVQPLAHWVTDGVIYCVVQAPDKEASCQHHAERGLACDELRPITGLRGSRPLAVRPTATRAKDRLVGRTASKARQPHAPSTSSAKTDWSPPRLSRTSRCSSAATGRSVVMARCAPWGTTHRAAPVLHEGPEIRASWSSPVSPVSTPRSDSAMQKRMRATASWWRARSQSWLAAMVLRKGVAVKPGRGGWFGLRDLVVDVPADDERDGLPGWPPLPVHVEPRQILGSKRSSTRRSTSAGSTA